MESHALVEKSQFHYLHKSLQL